MILKEVIIKNVRSFKEQTSVSFNNTINILIGPNGGGKSNLLDIITIILKYHLVKNWKITYKNYKVAFLPPKIYQMLILLDSSY